MDHTPTIDHLVEHGWAVVKIMDEATVDAFVADMHEELWEFGSAPFYPEIPRVLGGMLKNWHFSMLRSAHAIRKHARPYFFALLSQGYDRLAPFLDFPCPDDEHELSCNPDALFVSSGKPVRFPPSLPTSDDGLWWHVDTDKPNTFLQASVVLQNPEGSEEFCVLDKSHRYFDAYADSIRSDFHLLSPANLACLYERGCEPVHMRVPPGHMVVWFSSTVHTVQPFRASPQPRMQTYVCFATTKHLSPETMETLTMAKALAVLMGASCRHCPYPCDASYQYGSRGMSRDYISAEELPGEFFGSNPDCDYTDAELSVYGLTRASFYDAVHRWRCA